MMIGKSLFAMAAITVCCQAFAQGSFDACLASKLAERPGQISAAVAARKTCRDEFPLTAEEREALKLRAQATPVAAPAAGTAAATAPPLTVSAVAAPATPTVATVASPSPALAAAPAPVAAVPLPPVPAAPVSLPSAAAGHGVPAGGPKH